MDKPHIEAPHDRLVRSTFGQARHAVPLLRMILPPEIGAGLRWSTLRLLPGSFIDAQLQERITDLLFEVRSAVTGETSLAYVLSEHSSTVQQAMALRLLDYQVRIWNDWRKKNPRAEKMPPILPIVVHHGAEPWTAPKEFRELLGGPPAWRQPAFCYFLFSLHGMTQAELMAKDLTPEGKVALAALQFAPRSSAEQLSALLGYWSGPLLQVARGSSSVGQLVALFNYVRVTVEIAPQTLSDIVERQVSRKVKNIMNTTHMQSIQQGKAELLIAQLTSRFGMPPDEIIERIKQADVAAAERWGIRLLTAETLEQVFAED